MSSAPPYRTDKVFYIELQTRDLAATKAFLAAVFGWSFKDYGPDYASFDEGDHLITGGIYRSERAGTVDGGGALVVIYNQALEATLAKVQAAGGRISRPIFSFPGGRRFHLIEPGGNELAVCSLGDGD